LFVDNNKANKLNQNKAVVNKPQLARKRKLSDHCDTEDGKHKQKLKHDKSDAAKTDSSSKIDKKVLVKGKKFKRAKQTKIKHTGKNKLEQQEGLCIYR